MKNVIGFLLIIVGLAVFFVGLNRKNSLAGEMSDAGTSVANRVDGGTRTPQHVTYMVVGGVLAVVGIGIVASGRRTMTSVTKT
jgi:Protein of unknown function (DUF3185)